MPRDWRSKVEGLVEMVAGRMGQNNGRTMVEPSPAAEPGLMVDQAAAAVRPEPGTPARGDEPDPCGCGV